MANNKKEAKILALIFNVVIFVFELAGIFLSFKDFGTPQKVFVYFTQDSNILLGICSFIYVLSLVRDLKGNGTVPKAVHAFKFVATNAVTLTMVTVLAVLIPAAGGYETENVVYYMLQSSNFFMHLVCPSLAIFSFLFFEHTPKIKFPCTVLAVLPAALYAGISIYLNYMRILYGPYPFLHVYEQSITVSVMWTVAIVGGSYVMGIVIWVLNKLFGGK